MQHLSYLSTPVSEKVSLAEKSWDVFSPFLCRLQPAKIWIDTQGNLTPVLDSHEQWANQHGHEIEELLAQGWVRVQNVPPPYLLIDFHVPLNAAQAKAVGVLFENRFEQVVVEYQGEARGFVDGEEALEYALSRK